MTLVYVLGSISQLYKLYNSIIAFYYFIVQIYPYLGHNDQNFSN